MRSVKIFSSLRAYHKYHARKNNFVIEEVWNSCHAFVVGCIFILRIAFGAHRLNWNACGFVQITNYLHWIAMTMCSWWLRLFWRSASISNNDHGGKTVNCVCLTIEAFDANDAKVFLKFDSRCRCHRNHSFLLMQIHIILSSFHRIFVWLSGLYQAAFIKYFGILFVGAILG